MKDEKGIPPSPGVSAAHPGDLARKQAALRERLAHARIEVMDDAMVMMLQSKTPAEKIAMIGDANRTARALLATQILRLHPDWSEKQVRREVARRMASAST